MKISEFVDELLAIAAEHGDLEVMKMSVYDGEHKCQPVLAQLLVTSDKRIKHQWLFSGNTALDHRGTAGDKVVHITQEE